MTPEGINKLADYQRAYWPKDWKFTATQNDIDEIKLAYMDALAEYDDAVVLRGYLASLKEWAKMPNIAQIMTAADGIAYKMQPEVTRDGYRCVVCKKPWNGDEDFGRNQSRQPGEYAKIPLRSMPDELIGRCPNCNAILDKPVPAWVFLGGHELADDVEF